MIEYTKKQGQYLTYIYYYTKLNGEPPSEADMQRYFRASPPTVHQMVLKLEEKGLISRIPNTPRAIKVVVPSNKIPELGEPIERKGEILKQVWSQEKYTRAYWFAAEAHKAQLIPGKDLPYLIHIGLVSMEIIACLNVEKEHDGDLAVQCAILHDVIEDTSIMYPEIEEIFGERVAQGVLALTKDENIPEERRMQDSLQRIRQQPHEVWMVKLADRISNLAAPPQYWEKEKIANYRKEAIEIYDALYDASHYLSKRLEKKIDEYQVYL